MGLGVAPHRGPVLLRALRRDLSGYSPEGSQRIIRQFFGLHPLADYRPHAGREGVFQEVLRI
jgi:hypothetical protein